MTEKVLETQVLKTATATYQLEVYSDSEGLYRWRVLFGKEEVGSCNQGYKSKTSVYSNLERQAQLLGMYSQDSLVTAE